MTKHDFMKAIAEKANLSQADANRFLDAMIATIEEVMVNKESVSLPGLGTFSTQQRPERTGRNPRTGEAMTIRAATVPHFKISPQLKLRANQ